MKKTNIYSMLGRTRKASHILERAHNDGVEMFIDGAGRVFNKAGEYLADAVEFEPSMGLCGGLKCKDITGKNEMLENVIKTLKGKKVPLEDLAAEVIAAFDTEKKVRFLKCYEVATGFVAYEEKVDEPDTPCVHLSVWQYDDGTATIENLWVI